MALQTYRDLEAWQRAIDLVEAVYVLTRGFPNAERFGLTSQTQRASVSIPSNIAEGYGRSHRGDYLHHLSMARGSLMELEIQLTIAVRLR
ncbi:MAG TPA: four helix bundle protein, partial [Phycisphaerae bacterium]|nr:four helix bundle protein [Phycisphaerae bacterium]